MTVICRLGKDSVIWGLPNIRDLRHFYYDLAAPSSPFSVPPCNSRSTPSQSQWCSTIPSDGTIILPCPNTQYDITCTFLTTLPHQRHHVILTTYHYFSTRTIFSFLVNCSQCLSESYHISVPFSSQTFTDNKMSNWRKNTLQTKSQILLKIFCWK